MCKSSTPSGVVTTMPPPDSDHRQSSKASTMGAGAFADGDSSGSDTSIDPEPEDLHETAADHTHSMHNHTDVTGVVESDSSVDEYVCGDEYRGPYYVETAEQERDELLGGIPDKEQREIHYQAYLRMIDNIEVGYGC